jgi:putative PIN family toxin of toxin-antitoxin system
MEIVMDTDVMVAAMRSPQGASRAWLRAVLLKEVELILSVPLILQYEAVLHRPEHLMACKMSKREVNSVLDNLSAVCKRVKVSYLWRPMLKDPGDEMVLEAAVNGQADQILSFNQRDFKGIEKFSIKIAKPGDAWRAWKGGRV